MDELAPTGRLCVNPSNMDPRPEPDQVRPGLTVDLAEMQRRVARLETGVRLVAETLRRVHHDLSGTLASLREEVVLTATSVDVRRIVMEALQPVEAAIRSVAGALQEPGVQLESMVESIPESQAGEHDEGEEPLAFVHPERLDEAAAAQHPPP